MAKTAPQMKTYAHARAALLEKNATKQQLREALQEATVQLRVAVGRGVPKVEAARLLGISRPSLDRWIAGGRIATVQVGKRSLVDADSLASLLVEVERLRELGTTRGVVAAALHRLAERDADVQAQLAQMLGPGLEALERGDLVPVTIPPTFGPED
jgi:excisionase family DNA binding protein